MSERKQNGPYCADCRFHKKTVGYDYGVSEDLCCREEMNNPTFNLVTGQLMIKFDLCSDQRQSRSKESGYCTHLGLFFEPKPRVKSAVLKGIQTTYRALSDWVKLK